MSFPSTLVTLFVSDGCVNYVTWSTRARVSLARCSQRHYQIDRQVRYYSKECSEFTATTNRPTERLDGQHSHDHEIFIFEQNVIINSKH